MIKADNGLPVGVIGENSRFSYGYNGKSYYVTEGSLEHLITRMELSLEEAKQMYTALSFTEVEAPNSKTINGMVKRTRKDKLTNPDDLFNYFANQLLDE